MVNTMIEKLKTHEEIYEGVKMDAYPSKKEIMDKINELIDYINPKEIEDRMKCCEKCNEHSFPTRSCFNCACHKDIKVIDKMEEEKQDWETEFREYFDKTLKPKKPTIQNLDRELIIDFIKKQLQSCKEQTKKEILDYCLINSHKVEEGEFVWLKDLINKLK